MAAALGIAVASLAGLVLGSYAVTAGVRLARSEQSSAGRSHCDACRSPLGFAHTAPIISYLALRGRCYHCRGAIDPIHLVGEVAGATVVGAPFALAQPARAVLLAGLGLVLIALSAVDWKIQRLPNPLVLIAAISCGLLALERSTQQLLIGLAAAGISILLLGLVRRFSTRGAKPPGLGLGDIKLAAGLALWLGLQTPAMLLGAAILGLAAMGVLRPADGRLAFGPMIAIAGWIVGVATEAPIWLR